MKETMPLTQAELPGLYASDERTPFPPSKDQLGTLRVLGVTNGDNAIPDLRHLSTLPAISSAVAGLAPFGAAQVHVRPTSSINFADAERDNASALSVSQAAVIAVIPSASSSGWPLYDPCC